jgi:hypothetical protein
MLGKTNSAGSIKGFSFDWRGTDAIANLQRELLETYEQASRA